MRDRYTPEQMREMVTAPSDTSPFSPLGEVALALSIWSRQNPAQGSLAHEQARYSKLVESAVAMLRQAAADAEALAVQAQEVARLTAERDTQARSIATLQDARNVAVSAAAENITTLTAERAKVRELREWLAHEAGTAIQCDEQSADVTDGNWFRGKAEAFAYATKYLDALGLTGEAQP